MADLRDEQGNPIHLTDEHGNPVQLTDEYGKPMHLTGVATTVESGGPAHGGVTEIQTGAEGGNQQQEVHRSSSSSSSSSEDDGQGGRRKKKGTEGENKGEINWWKGQRKGRTHTQCHNHHHSTWAAS
uniref:Putative dehydrin LEA n=1 Tax=Davidia involucrata TaxID=16924 RepID=A0A5B7BQP6_DAVIN